MILDIGDKKINSACTDCVCVQCFIVVCMCGDKKINSACTDCVCVVQLVS